MSLILYIAIMAGVTYLIRVVPFTVFQEKDPEPFSAKLPLLHSLRSAQCHDHSCHFLLHGQRDHSSRGNSRRSFTGVLESAPDRGGSGSLGSGSRDRIFCMIQVPICKRYSACGDLLCIVTLLTSVPDCAILLELGVTNP